MRQSMTNASSSSSMRKTLSNGWILWLLKVFGIGVDDCTYWYYTEHFISVCKLSRYLAANNNEKCNLIDV